MFFAKLRKQQFLKLRKLRKSRILILRFFTWMNQLEFGQNDHRQDASHFSFGSRRNLSGSFYPNMTFKFEKFWKSRIQFRLTNFSKKIFNIKIFTTFAIAFFLRIKLCCVAIAIDTKKLNCVICEIVFFPQSQFPISQLSQFSQFILQPWTGSLLSWNKMSAIGQSG